MSIKTIVEDASFTVKKMGGGEQFIGRLKDLANNCGFDDTVDFILELGEVLEDSGLQLIQGAGEPEDLYVSPLED